MATRELARKLGALQIIPITQSGAESALTKLDNAKQKFRYLLVLDFEATCWEKSDPRRRHPAEIIEFPVVLYDVQTSTIVQEFQQYVKPTEHPQLSEFCTALTGITQEDVNGGAPLSTTLMAFKKWLFSNMDRYSLKFPHCNNEDHKNRIYDCVFVTWSDWDLATCLRHECERKSIHLDSMFRKWIDIRAVYKNNYNRRLTGLNGALQEMGLTFEGKEHCGLHDARNTARLAGKIIDDGWILDITSKR